jgi:signal transduction histidine kinase
VAGALAHAVHGASSSLAIHAELLERAVTGSLDAPLEKMRRWLTVIGAENRRLESLLDALMAELGVGARGRAHDSLGSVLARVETLAGLYAAHRRVRLATAARADGPPVVPEAVRQAFLAAVVAAVDAAAAGDEVRVEAAVGGGTARLTVHGARALEPAAGARLASCAAAEAAAGGTLVVAAPARVELAFREPAEPGA